MLYVSGKSFGGMYLLADSETGEEVETTEEAILDKAKCGVPIYRVYKEGNDYIIRLPGIGENASLEYYAMTCNKQYLLDEYDRGRNALSVTSIKYNCSKKVHWVCPKGHKYMSMIRERTVRNAGCPYCASRKVLQGDNDFETWCKSNNRQDLLDEWDTERNNIKPSDVTPFSHSKLWWLCPKGHSYEMILNSRTQDILSHNCPICSGRKVQSGINDLETWCKSNDKQYILDEWDSERNNVKPSEVAPFSNKKLWWVCLNGHSFSSVLSNRTCLGRGCPYCASQKVLRGYNDFETWCKDNNRQDLLDEWDYESNTKQPYGVTPHSSDYKAHWICPRGHHYISSIDHRVRDGSGCKYCSKQTSFPEQSILFYLKQGGLNAENRYRYDNKYEIDIYLPDYNIGIEYDGANWHSSDDNIRRDEEKNRVLSEAGIQLIRLREEGCPSIEKYDSVVVTAPILDLDKCIRELKQILTSYGVVFDADINTERDRQSILGEYLSAKKESSIKVTHPHIAYEWCHERNGKLKPDMVTAGSNNKVWWRCGVCNTEYQAVVSSRCINKTGCQSCARMNPKSYGEHTFTEYPELESFWSDKNPPMRETSFYTKQPMIICCPKCNFEETIGRISDRVKKHEGLTCKKCGYHVKVDKWERERRDFLEKQKRDEDMMASFNEFLKKQGLSSIGE